MLDRHSLLFTGVVLMMGAAWLALHYLGGEPVDAAVASDAEAPPADVAGIIAD